MLEHGEGIEITQEIMASAGPKLAALVLLGALVLYVISKIRGHEINFFIYMIIFFFPTSNLYIDLGFHLFFHRVLIIIYTFIFIYKITGDSLHKKAIYNSTTIAALLFLIASLVGLAVADFIVPFIRYWLAFFSSLLVYLFILEDINSPKRLEGMILSCLISGFVWSVVGLGLFITKNTDLMVQDVNQLYRVSSLNGDANYFGSILIGWLPLAMYGFLLKDYKEKIFSLIACTSMCLAVIFTYSRGAYLAGAVVFCLSIIFFIKYTASLSSIFSFGKAFSFIVLGLIILAGFFARYESLSSRLIELRQDKTGGSGRLYIWADTIKIGLENPIGVGLGNLRAYTAQRQIQYATAGADAHNAYLNAFAETGFLGAILYALFIGSGLIKIFSVKRIVNQELRFWFLGIYTGLIGILVTQLFLSNVYNENLFVQMAMFLAVVFLGRGEGSLAEKEGLSILRQRAAG